MTKDAAADDDNNASLGARTGWRDKILLRLLVGDSRGPLAEPGWAARFSHADVHGEKDDVGPWPEEMELDILGLGLDEDAHQYKRRPAGPQAQIVQYWQTAWAFTSRIPGAAFCTTRNPRRPDRPYAGIVPVEAKRGNCIFIANGGKVPFVLRGVESSPCYTLIGECYIHGIMYGAPPDVQQEADVEVRLI